MDYYLLSEEPLKAADFNKKNGLYRMSVHMATLAIDLMLKSVLYRLEPDNILLVGHDHIGILRVLEKEYPKEELKPIVKMSRKYFNDSRYSRTSNLVAFTEQLAAEFLGYARQVKDYVDTDCQATIDDLQKKFGNK